MFPLKNKRSQYSFLYSTDWIVGISSSPHQLLSSRLHYSIPTLLQSHAHSSNTSLPSTYGWMFLTMSREWRYDNMIKVIPHYARNRSTMSPCMTEYSTDYVGHHLANSR